MLIYIISKEISKHMGQYQKYEKEESVNSHCCQGDNPITYQVQSRTGNNNRALCALQLQVTNTILNRIIKTGAIGTVSFSPPILIPLRPIMLYQPPRYTQFPSTQGHILAPQSGSNTLKYTIFRSFRYLYKMIRRIQLVHQSVTSD